MINKIDFTAKKLTFNAGLFLLLDNTDIQRNQHQIVR